MASVTLASSLGSCSHKKALDYPEAPQDGTVDTIFGMEVSDIYRPLENDTAAATLAWVEAENKLTRSYLDAIPFRADIVARLNELNDYVKRGLPSHKKDGKYYYYENNGLQNQSVLYRKNALSDAQGEVFLDPNKLSDDGTVALTGVYMSQDGKLTAYTISRSGSDWTEIYVMDTETKQLLDDHVEWAKFTGAAWDGDGFYYSAYPAPEAGKEFSNENAGHRVMYHKIGTPQSQDKVVFTDPQNPYHFHSVQMTDTQPELFLEVGGQGIGNALKVRKGDKWIDMVATQDYEVDVIDVIDNKAYIRTSYGAPKNRLMLADLANPAIENWKEIIPEGEGVMTAAAFSGDNLFVSYEQDAASRVEIRDKEGKKLSDMQLPGYGSVYFSLSKEHPEEVFYSFTSFTSPAIQYSYDTATGESKHMYTPDIKGFDSNDYVTEQVFYPSKDGTKIPMYLTYRKDLKKNGKTPVYLYGYGGFNISLLPAFSAFRLPMLENGVIYAQANLRGGSEYGEEWHLAGTKMNKINVFDDFIAAAEYLIDEGWTSPEHITIEGGSNGGLLVGATVNMRPDLFKVAIPRVGVMDMMRYHLFTIGWNWASDYGTSADSPEMAKYLLSYSPLHTIKNDGTPYPAILITTADHDDRVVPAHSFKYAAALQAADTGDAPKLIRIDSKAGHGAGKPIAKIIDEYADIYSFMFENIGIKPAKK